LAIRGPARPGERDHRPGHLERDRNGHVALSDGVSWAGLCPGNDESAGKRRSTRLRKGGQWLKATLVQSAWPASRAKGSYFKAQFHRIRARRGPKKAAIAVAASMLTSAYHMLKNGTVYQDLGEVVSR